MYSAEIKITLKKTVADPQGLIVKHALEALGFSAVAGARMGKFIILQIDAKDKAEAEVQAAAMCQKLLANPVIEDFLLEVKQI